MRDREGRLDGLLRLLLLTAAFGWLENRFGFGRGCSCTGMGCGLFLLLLFLILLCGTLSGIDWHRMGLNGLY
jgi:hypothetical protein